MLLYFNNENQTLYPNAWEYNNALMLDELREMVIKNGGKVKKETAGSIENRSIYEIIWKAKDQNEKIDAILQEVETDKKNEIRRKVREANQEEIDKWEAVENKPVKINNNGYLLFTLNNKYYAVYIDENPFFEHRFIKTPINEKNEISRHACMEELPHIFPDEFMKADHTAPEVKKARTETAKAIFEYITTAEDSYKRIDTYKKRVPNYYNNGYHYETVKEKEQFKKIDF